MQDIYSAIVGEPVSDQERLMAIAQKLRKQQQIGQLGQITGDKVLAPMGAGMVDTANTQAENLGRRGEQARYRRYQEQASARMDERERNQLAWQKENAKLERALRRELEAARNATVLAAARIRESDSADKKYKPMTVSQVQKLTDAYENTRRYADVVDGFKDEFAGLKVPGLRSLTNTMAANVPILTSQGAEDAQNWWAQYHNIYTLPERNEMFGATLTDNEQAEWKRNAISENMTAAQIRTRLKWYQDKIESKKQAIKRNLKAAKYDPELIDTIYTDPVVDSEVEDLPPRP